MKTQLCLLSGELMPNVIGVLHERPERVIPAVTKESAPQVASLAAALQAAGCRAALKEAVHVLPYDLDNCTKTLNAVVAETPDLTVNWTGGTKIMSFAARKAAEAPPHNTHAIYVNTAGHEVLYEEKPGVEPAQRQLLDSAKLGLNTLVHILAAGHKVEGAKTLDTFRRRCTPASHVIEAATLIKDARPWERTEVFRLAGAGNRPYRPRGLSAEFLRVLTDAHLIQPAEQPGEFLLSTDTLLHPFYRESAQEANAKFLKSTFIEVFTWSQIRERSAADDVAWHVVLNPGETGRMAEFDVTVASEGRFLVVECKSDVQLQRVSPEHKALGDLVEEQAARTRRIGRLFGRWLLYVHRLRADYDFPGAQGMIASQEAKAREYGGRILWQEDLSDLPITVASFLNETKSVL